MYQNAIPRWLTKLEKTFLKHKGLAEMKENVHSLILYVEI